jgi:hypothetical protein
MATSLITRETAGGGATVKNAPLTNTEVDENFITLANNKVEIIDGTVAIIPDGTTGERPGSPSAGMLRFNTTENQFEGYDGTEWGAIGGGGGVAYTFHTSNYTTTAGEGVLADTTGGSFTVTLPASPDVGDTVVVADAGGEWGTNNLTIARNGETIEDDATDLVADISGVSITLVYDGTTWETYAQIGAASTDVVTIDNTVTLTNKTIAFGDNTLTDVASTNTSQTLTNKTLEDPIVTLGGTEGTAGQAIISQGAGQPPTFGAAGATITDETASSSDFYPALSDATSGNYTDAYVSSTKLFFQPSTGTLNATEFNSLSDVSVKTNVNEITTGLDVVNAIAGVEFDWKDNGHHSAGVIAQELEKVLPHLVSTSSEGMKSVNYAGLTAYLLSAIKELNSRIK